MSKYTPIDKFSMLRSWNLNSIKYSIPDLTWARRFGSIVSIKSKIGPTHQLCQLENETVQRCFQGKHLDIIEWLKILDLLQYEDLFKDFGGVEDLLDHSEADIRDMGVKISSHRAKIMSSLTGLRYKYYGNGKRFNDPKNECVRLSEVVCICGAGFKKKEQMRHSVAVDNSKTLEQRDTV